MILYYIILIYIIYIITVPGHDIILYIIYMILYNIYIIIYYINILYNIYIYNIISCPGTVLYNIINTFRRRLLSNLSVIS